MNCVQMGREFSFIMKIREQCVIPAQLKPTLDCRAALRLAMTNFCDVMLRLNVLTS